MSTALTNPAPVTRPEQNRINAQNSSGPTTEDGKNRVRLNAVKHGLSGEQILLPTECVEQFEASLAHFIRVHSPKTAEEFRLVGIIRDCNWRLERFRRIELNALTIATRRCLDELKDSPEPEHARRGIAETQAYLEVSAELARLGRHQARITRELATTKQELANLQKTRRDERQSKLQSISFRIGPDACQNAFDKASESDAQRDAFFLSIEPELLKDQSATFLAHLNPKSRTK